VAADLQGQALAREVSLQVAVADSAPPVSGDATQLRQAIANLIDNAIKYSEAGGQIDVRVWGQDAAAMIQVKDSGVGIGPADLPHIFDTFYRVKDGNRASGVGLGLTLVQSIVEAHGGQVWVDSQKGAGSTFTLRLPAIATDPENATGQPAVP
jgi:signal transduction histidine kinase